MAEVIRSVEYRGYRIQERRINLFGAAVTTHQDGTRETTGPEEAPYVQWAILRVSPSGREEEVTTAMSEEDAKRRIDELTGNR
jgi:hypothetical protein